MRVFNWLQAALFTVSVALPIQSVADTTNRVGLISGGVNGTYAQFAQDMANALNSEELRVLPILGRGSEGNIYDLIEISEVDVAIVQSDVLQAVKDADTSGGIGASIRYIMQLYNEEIHVVATSDITSVTQLHDQPISIGGSGSGTAMTSRLIFDALGIAPQFYEMSNSEALNLLQSGVLKASVFVVGKPSRQLQEITLDTGLRLLPLELPPAIEFPYSKAQFSALDYSGLVPENQYVNTVSVGAVLAVYNWRDDHPQYTALTEFTDQLFATLPLFQSDENFHSKWREVDPVTEVVGWTRFKPADNWLSQAQ